MAASTEIRSRSTMALTRPATDAISAPEFEQTINRLIPRSEGENSPTATFDDALFDRIRKLLDLVGKSEWSKRPRTYVVLLMIDCVDAMDAFVDAGLFDIQLPYHESRLPAPLRDQETRDRFLNMQSLVLTKATDLENGVHKHFSKLTQQAD